MNPLKSITGTIVTGIVLSAIVMAIFADGISNHIEWTVWFHVLAGVAWIGLLYYFNFVQVPGVAKAVSEADNGGPGPAAINKYVAPTALLWFRWAAVATWLSGAAILAKMGILGAAFTFLALVTGAYLVVYKLLGRGAYGGAEYLDPSSDPLGYVVELPGKMLAMFGEVFLWIPAGWWNSDPLRAYSLAAGAGGLVLVALLLAPVFRDGANEIRVLLGRLVLGTVGSMLPLAAGAPGGRNLIVPSIAILTKVGMSWCVLIFPYSVPSMDLQCGGTQVKGRGVVLSAA